MVRFDLLETEALFAALLGGDFRLPATARVTEIIQHAVQQKQRRRLSGRAS